MDQQEWVCLSTSLQLQLHGAALHQHLDASLVEGKDAQRCAETRRLKVNCQFPASPSVHVLSHIHLICVLRLKKAADIYRNEPTESEQIPPVLTRVEFSSSIKINGLFGSQLMSSRHQTCTKKRVCWHLSPFSRRWGWYKPAFYIGRRGRMEQACPPALCAPHQWKRSFS